LIFLAIGLSGVSVLVVSRRTGREMCRGGRKKIYCVVGMLYEKLLSAAQDEKLLSN
jgi:hypothetical protein